MMSPISSRVAVAAASHGNIRAVSVRKRVGLARSISVMASLIVAAVAAGNAAGPVHFVSARVDRHQSRLNPDHAAGWRPPRTVQ